MILIIDNYDSFTYNLAQRFGELDPALEIVVVRNDQIQIAEIDAMGPTHIVISPGPCTPDEAGISMQVVQHFSGSKPILGVCLGHQSIGQQTGGNIVRAKRIMHGKTDLIHHNGQGLFAEIPSPMLATRYHSLVIDPPSLCREFIVNAWTHDADGNLEIMAIQHRSQATFGVQFHPESFLTECGPKLLQNFLGTAQR